MVRVNTGSIIPRGNSYRVTVSCYDINGKRIRLTGTAHSVREAELLRTALFERLENNIPVSTSRITIKQYLDQWLESNVRTTLSQHTYELYHYMTHIHISPHIGNIRLTQLRPHHIQKLYSDKLKLGLSPRTVQIIHVTLHKALKNTVRTGLIDRNPCEMVDVPKAQRHEYSILTEADITYFLSEAQKGDYYTLFYVILYTGIRRGEALALRWGDVDLLGCQLSVNRTIQVVNNIVTFKTPKSAKSRRQVALSPSTCVVLRKHHEDMELLRRQLRVRPVGDSDLVFCHPDGKPLLPNTVTHAWIKLVRRCGFKNIRLHDARHTHASLMLKQGVPLKVVQERLGHSSIAVTGDIYAHVTPGMQGEAAQGFDDKMVTKNGDQNIKLTGF